MIKIITITINDFIPNNKEEMTYFSFPTRQDVKEFYKAGKKFY